MRDPPGFNQLRWGVAPAVRAPFPCPVPWFWVRSQRLLILQHAEDGPRVRSAMRLRRWVLPGPRRPRVLPGSSPAQARDGPRPPDLGRPSGPGRPPTAASCKQGPAGRRAHSWRSHSCRSAPAAEVRHSPDPWGPPSLRAPEPPRRIMALWSFRKTCPGLSPKDDPPGISFLGSSPRPCLPAPRFPELGDPGGNDPFSAGTPKAQRLCPHFLGSRA